MLPVYASDIQQIVRRHGMIETKHHSADFMGVHDRTRGVHHVLSPPPGSYNDMQQAKKLIFYTYTSSVLQLKHMVTADLA